MKKCNKNSQIGKRVSTFIECSSIFIVNSNNNAQRRFSLVQIPFDCFRTILIFRLKSMLGIVNENNTINNNNNNTIWSIWFELENQFSLDGI